MKVITLAFAAILACAVPAAAQDAAEIAFWNSVKDSRIAEELRAYIDAYPNGRFVPLARIRINGLTTQAPAPNPSAPILRPSTPAVPPTFTVRPVGPARPAPGLGLPGQPSPPAAVSGVFAEKPVYVPFEPITLTWSGFTAPHGWVGVYSVAEPPFEIQKSVQFNLQPSGTVTFDGVAPGIYEARVLTGESGRALVEGRFRIEVRTLPPDGVAGIFNPRIVASKTSYQQFEPVTVNWADIRAPNGWVALFREGQSTPVARTQVTFLGNKLVNGAHTFNQCCGPGRYEVRVLAGAFNNEFVLARNAITVQDSTAGVLQPSRPGATPPSPTPPGPVAQVIRPGTIAPGTPLNGPTLTRLGEIVLLEKPKDATGDDKLLERMFALADAHYDTKCANAEVYTWALGANAQARAESLIGTSHEAMRVRGYTLSDAKPKSDTPSMAFEALNSDRRARNSILMVFWHVEASDLLLMLCAPDLGPGPGRN